MAASSYIALTKPRILPLVLFSGLPALLIASGGWPSLEMAVAVLVGTSFAAGAANTLNSYLERDLDALMLRTQTRPLPSGELEPAQALFFGLGLGLLGTGILGYYAGPLAALLSIAALLIYVFIYTLWLKPRTPFAVVVGGLSGAIAPVIADAAIHGYVSAAGWMLFAIIFVWQPPHFYAIALYRGDEYAKAGFPMLPAKIGNEATYRRIIVWILGLIPVTLLPFFFTPVGAVYALVTAGAGAFFLWEAFRLKREKTDAAARRLFFVSLFYLIGIFAVMILDLALGL